MRIKAALSSKKKEVCTLHDIIFMSYNKVEKVGTSSYIVIALPSRANEVNLSSIKNKVRIPHDIIASSSEEEADSSSHNVAAFSNNEEKLDPSFHGVIALSSNGDEVRLSVCSKPSYQASLPLKKGYTKNPVACTYIVDEKILGSGGFGTVRCCTRKGTEEKFAIKTMKLKCEGQLEEYRQEAYRHKQCSGHLNVVNFVEKFESSSRVHMVMELCEGGALDTYLSSFPTGLPHPNIPTILSQVMSALHHIHGLGIVHRDIKAQNILLAFNTDKKTMTIKLADFGLATRFRCQDTGVVIPCTGIVGTKGYKAPEMLWAEEYGAAVDLWSTGIMLVKILTGEHPKFLQSETTDDDDDDDDDEEYDYDEVLDFESAPQNNFCVCLKNLITGMLQCNPAKRITAAKALNHCWIRNRGCCKHKEEEI